jgi:hypothetical protein
MGVLQRDLDDLERVPGLRPPLPWWAPLAWFLALGTALTFVVVVLVRPPGPLDQSDPAYQRDGLLIDGPVVAQDLPGVELGGRPVVLLFVREVPDRQALQRWAAEVPERADVRLVLAEPTTVDLPVETVVDTVGSIAQAVDLPTPVDGGRPVGYAVVDSDRQVRYATLDPEYLVNAFEVTTIVRAVS